MCALLVLANLLGGHVAQISYAGANANGNENSAHAGASLPTSQVAGFPCSKF